MHLTYYRAHSTTLRVIKSPLSHLIPVWSPVLTGDTQHKWKQIQNAACRHSVFCVWSSLLFYLSTSSVVLFRDLLSREELPWARWTTPLFAVNINTFKFLITYAIEKLRDQVSQHNLSRTFDWSSPVRERFASTAVLNVSERILITWSRCWHLWRKGLVANAVLSYTSPKLWCPAIRC